MFWQIYHDIALAMILTQLGFLFQSCKNYGYALRKSRRKCTAYKPRTWLTVPCKGIDNAFDRNITSLFDLDYDDYYLAFVVEDSSDRAYERLCQLKEDLAAGSKALDVFIFTADIASGCSQKIHNLLYSCRKAPEDIEVFAFADSDACLRADWLSHLVHPLRKARHGAATGYRWFVPERNNLASLALSAMNAKIAQLLGNTSFNQAWGGSMAIRTETFRKIGLDPIWQKAISDDLSLSYAVKKAGLKILFAPACLVASYESTTWPKLFEFTRRQFMITRVTTPGTWWFAVFCSVYSLAGLWAGAAIAVYAAMNGAGDIGLYITVPVLFLAGQILRSILRQRMITKLLPNDAGRMKPAIYADILGSWVWSWLLFGCIAASAFGRTITWRNIRYRLVGRTETVILDRTAKKD